MWKLGKTIDGLKSRSDRIAKEEAAIKALEAKSARESTTLSKKSAKKK
jgi:hypothetical protein